MCAWSPKKPGISKSTVGRYFKLFELQPHRSKSFKLSTDPFFVEKVRDIVGLYLNPPDHALVLYVTKKAKFRRSNARTHPTDAALLPTSFFHSRLAPKPQPSTTTDSPVATRCPIKLTIHSCDRFRSISESRHRLSNQVLPCMGGTH